MANAQVFSTRSVSLVPNGIVHLSLIQDARGLQLEFYHGTAGLCPVAFVLRAIKRPYVEF